MDKNEALQDWLMHAFEFGVRRALGPGVPDGAVYAAMYLSRKPLTKQDIDHGQEFVKGLGRMAVWQREGLEAALDFTAGGRY